jgi:SNF2 family DNA or RNA helicase
MADPSDPWDWNTDRVVRELCTDNRSWNPPSNPPRLPNLTRLEASLRENEVDGEVLLGNASSEVDFFPDLEIKAIKHKETVRSAIAQFRRRSKKYKIFKVRQDQEDDEGDDGELSGELDEATRKKRLEDERRADDNGVILQNSARDLPSAAMVLDAPQEAATSMVTNSAALVGVDHVISAVEPARKKRRIAPMTVSTDVDVNLIRNIPTEADVILNRLGLGNAAPELNEEQAFIEMPAYLWENPLPRVELVDFDVTDEPLTQQDQELEIYESRPPPYLRRRQVGRLLKRRLLRRDPVFRPAKADMVPGGDNPDHNLIIPPMGESDGEEEYDSETWEEIQAEQAEREGNGKLNALTTDEKHSMIDDIIAEYRSAWEERKLPRLERKAHRIWNNARRRGLKGAIVKEQKALDNYDERLAKYRENIVAQEWRDQVDIRKTAGVLEATIEDRQLSSWMLELLKSPTEPKKLPKTPRNIQPRSSRPVLQGEEEILTSESEDGLDDFIVEDDVQAHGEVMSDAGPEKDTGNVEDAAGDTAMQGVSTANGGLSASPKPPPDMGYSPGETAIGAVDELPGNSGGFMEIETTAGKVSDAGDKGIAANGHGIEIVNDDEEDLLDLTLPEVPKKESPKKAHIASTPRHPKKPVFIDLVTPGKERSRQTNSQQSVRTPGSAGSAHRFVELSPQFLETLSHRERLVEKELMKLDKTYRGPIFHFAHHCPVEELWKDFILPALDARTIPKPPFKDNENEEKDKYIASLVMRFFDIFTSGKALSIQQFRLLFDGQKNAIKDKEDRFPEFVTFIRTLFLEYKKSAKRHSSTPARPPSSSHGGPKDKELHNPNKTGEDDEDNVIDEIHEPPSNKKRKPAIVRDRAAASLREGDRRRAEEQEQRKKAMRARLAVSGSSASQRSHLIINESKEDDQGFIYVPDKIAACIKKHQVEGVRFLWNQIVMDSQVRQGCLLAHTMGLGKTMQIITLLMVIADAAASDDQSISGQIPEDLKESRTLILVPSGLVNNWIEELQNWTSVGHGLGDFVKIHSDLSPVDRIEIIRDWSNYGGVLVMGYELFKGFVDVEGSISEDLLNKPNIVVADEAHMLKNPNSQIHKATAQFRTHSRIALTGSPLANNVLEYHSMINWVAPNYLSDLKEFRQDYAVPIEAGLSSDSTSSERRRALTKLQVLKKTVATKVHRRTIAVLKEDIPAKMEFVIHVPLTDIQRQAYETYMRFHSANSSYANNARGFATLNILALLCNHPACFRTRLIEAKNKKGATTDEVAGNAALPPQLVSEELQLLPNEDIDTEIYSWKIPLLNQILDESAKLGDRVLIFSQSIPTLNYLEKIFRKRRRHFLRLDGATPINRRQNMVKDFNQNQFDVFLISTNAGGLGLNIVGANRVVIFDFKYNPQNEQQAVGRAYRLGQEKPVFVYRFVCGGTFEEKMQNKGVFKMQLASRVVDKKNPIPKAQRFEELFAMPTDPKQQDLRSFRSKDKVLDSILDSEALHLGIRSIVEADTFEEEDLEEQQLTVEEELEAQRLIDEHRARLTGKPPPLRPDNQSVAMVSTSNVNLPTEHQAHLLGNQIEVMSTESPAQPNGTVASNNIVNLVAQAHLVAPPPPMVTPVTTAIVPPLAPFHLPSQNGPHGTVPQESFHSSSQDSAVQPVLGISTQVRHSSAKPTNRPPLEEIKYWDDNPQAYRGELMRAFASQDAVYHVNEKRRQTAQTIDTAFSEHAAHRNSEALNGARWAVMEAAKSQRFIEAVVLGLLRPGELASMDSGAITTQCHLWDDMTDKQWDEYILPLYITGDPEV